MTSYSWLVAAFVLYVIVDIFYMIINRNKLRNLKRIHALELKIAKEEVLKTLPIVQHCNRNTNYELIRHRWDPINCKHCLVCKDLLGS